MSILKNDCARRLTAVFLFSVLLAFCLQSCEKNHPADTPAPSEEVAMADRFATDVLERLYLWNGEVGKDLSRLSPDTCRFPMDVVKEIRYHDDSGREVDKWTILTDDLESVTGSLQGVGLTFGYDLQAGRISNGEERYFLVVNFVYENGPAQKAGLKRGDVIVTLDGEEITSANIQDAYDAGTIALGVTSVSGGVIGGDVRNVSLTAVNMYENPILVSRTFDAGGKKVGYLAYAAFDLMSSEELPAVCRKFKSEGIEELILDLRYNGGGYAFTEKVLASMLAPEANVLARDIFQTEVYNSELAAEWEEIDYDTNTYFSTSHKMNGTAGYYDIDVSDANLGISRLYVIVTGGTASASEGLVVGLRPYLDVTLVGTRTYGKYCAGILLAPDNFYTSRHKYSLIKDWGMYVMLSRFGDRDGNNAAMPDGIPADVTVKDDPLDGCQLGDENETMLRAALQAAGKVYPQAASIPQAYSSNLQFAPLEHGAPKGILVRTEVPPVMRPDSD